LMPAPFASLKPHTTSGDHIWCASQAMLPLTNRLSGHVQVKESWQLSAIAAT
jgi:hypothetical protein